MALIFSLDSREYITKFTENPPILDGQIDDPVWNIVDWQSDFIQSIPSRGENATQTTKFKIIYDKENLYVAIRAYDTNPELIVSNMTEHDNFGGDWVEINIDSYDDNRTGFSFTSMACGSNGDEYISDDGSNWDGSWNPIWTNACKIDNEGWSTEMKIPFSQLRFQDKEDQEWGIQVSRIIYRKNERSHWAEIKKDAPWVSSMGTLKGIKNIKTGANLEILPYSAWQIKKMKEDVRNLFRPGNEGKLRVGLDGKYMISQNLAADFTINPDFGQVEADPAEINLSGYETYQSERRPFFIEGNDIYSYPLTTAIFGGNYSSDELFYSRRIGAEPSGYRYVQESIHEEYPENTDIIAAVKLTGKTENGFSIGILESVTDKEILEYTVLDTTTGLLNKKEVTLEPYTNYFVGRLKKDFDDGNTVLGVMATSVVRDEDDAERSFLHSKAHTFGTDYYQRFGENYKYNAILNIVYSRIDGSKDVISGDQLSFPRYFNRPDAHHLRFNPNRTYLEGHGGTFRLSKSKGIVRCQTGFTWRSPGLELNDIGYLYQPDYMANWAWAGYSVEEPTDWLREFSVNLNERSEWNYAGDYSNTTINLNSNLSFKNNFSYYISLSGKNETESFTKLYGGPAILLPGLVEINTNFNSDYTKKFSYSVGYNTTIGSENNYYNRGGWAEFTLKATDKLKLSFNPSYSLTEDDNQYYRAITNGDSKDYLLAKIERQTFNFSFRINYIISPKLSLKYYGRPYITFGEYSNFKKVIDPKADNYDDRFESLGVDDITDHEYYSNYCNYEPDFSYAHFQSNLVLRWDYTAGSSIYFVWTQTREYSDGDSSFDFIDKGDEMFKKYPENIFLIKFNYWLNV